MSYRWLLVGAFAAAASIAVGCGDIEIPPGLDAGDGSVDDGSADAPIDALGDGPRDGSGGDVVDTGVDVTMDSPHDVGADVRPPDAMPIDAPVDTSMIDGGDASDGGPIDASIDADGGASDASDAGDASDAMDAAREASPPVVDQIQGVIVSTFAGSDVAGSQNANGTAATFDNPVTLALDMAGNVLVTEYDGDRVRSITPTGDVTTLVSQGDVFRPFAIVVGSDGTIVVQTDWNDNGVNNPTSGTLWKTLPGGFSTPLVEMLQRPRGLGALPNGTIGVSDRLANTVMILDPTTALLTPLAGLTNTPGFADDVGTLARFNEPYGCAAFSDGTLLVADSGNNRLRTIAPDGTVSTYAGDGNAGMVDGQRISAQLNAPRDVAIDAVGNVYFTDTGNHRIRRIDTTGVIMTIAGDGTPGFNDGAGEVAEFFGQEGLDVTPDGKTLYVTDGTLGNSGLPYNRIRKITIP